MSIPTYGVKRLDSGTWRNAFTINGVVVEVFRTAARAEATAKGERDFAELVGHESSTSRWHRERFGIELEPVTP